VLAARFKALRKKGDMLGREHNERIKEDEKCVYTVQRCA
jgi:hypothetical protein